ncbi:MAG TPA: SulP family inorganic anion transporter [Pirellulales bacterium]|nr:SulP family inorganic anion transporter [Pirellulales bacterium]
MNDQSPLSSDVPKAGFAGLPQNWKRDANAGFLVFLIALPLCLGISLACGYPAIAGVFTAIVGGILCSLLSNSELTIKGPAAGLIVIALGAVTEFGFTAGADPAADWRAYRMALGVGVAAGILQIGFALLRAGALSDFFPTSVVHGMLAAIGLIIMSKQIHTVLGVRPEANEPLQLFREIPNSLAHLNPEITVIGLLGLLLLFGLPLLKARWIRAVPAPMWVIATAVPLGLYFGLDHQQTYSFGGHRFDLGPAYLVNVPANMFEAIAFPDFSGLQTVAGWKWTIMFALIGSLESLLSAKAIDLIDPWKRKTNFDRDLLAVGLANVACALIGGLPMISEIVRSKANIDYGARTRFADMFHGIFLLLAVALVPGLIHEIPLAALAAMLVYTGFRLASPREFIHVYRIGKEQLLIFGATVAGILATDLLVGIAIGITLKLLSHVFNGAPLRSLFRPQITIRREEGGPTVLAVGGSAVFSNWIGLTRRIETAFEASPHVVIDLSETRLVDHTVMERLHTLKREFAERDGSLTITGLDDHRALAPNPHSARKKSRDPWFPH